MVAIFHGNENEEYKFAFCIIMIHVVMLEKSGKSELCCSPMR